MGKIFSNYRWYFLWATQALNTFHTESPNSLVFWETGESRSSLSLTVTTFALSVVFPFAWELWFPIVIQVYVEFLLDY